MATSLKDLGITTSPKKKQVPPKEQQAEYNDGSGNGSGNDSGDNDIEGFSSYGMQSSTMKQMLMNEMRAPLLQVLLYILLNLDQVNAYLYKYIPGLFSSSRDLNIRGVIAKGILFALSYYALTMFVL
jgi:hypothetical protein